MLASTFGEALRRLGLAATESVAAVRTELDRAVRNVAPEIDALLIFDEADGQLACVFAAGPRVTYFAGAQFAREDPATLPALALARGHRVVLGENDARGFHPGDAFAVAVPFGCEGGRASVVYAAATRDVTAARCEALVELIDHAGFAYTLAHEREAQQRRAEIDALTGLLTPRALRERLAVMIDRARFAPLARIALLFVDTDRFKTWNDTYGHASGDALLCALARVLRAAADSGDLVARNGGDEFCIVFADTEKSRAVDRATVLGARIAAIDTAALHRPGTDAPLTISASIGVAAYPADAQSPHGLLERADEAMYHCKRTGRNGVAYAGPAGTLVRA